MEFKIQKINISEIEECYLARVKYILTEIGFRGGIKFIVSEEESSIIYSPNHKNDQQINSMRFNYEFYDLKTQSNLLNRIDFKKPKNCLFNEDLIGFCFYQLMLGEEKQISSYYKFKDGNFLTKNLPSFKKEYASKAVVDQISILISNFLGHTNNSHNYLPPNKSFSLCLTHDVDKLNYINFNEILLNLSKTIYRKDTNYLKETINAIRNRNDYDIFLKWLNLKKEFNIKSCFYLSNRSTSPLTINDVKSRLDNSKVSLKNIKKLNEMGHEFGFHPPINAKNNFKEFAFSKKRIQDKLEFPIHGIRHHYWSLDWEKPYLTYRKHENAGFKYDTSMAWKDIPGFRSGTCLPYRTFDLERNRQLEHYVLPTGIMDSHIIPIKINLNENDKENIESNFLKILQEVKKYNGSLVIDCHAELIARKFYRKDEIKTILDLIKKYINTSETWVTTPWELIKFYHQNRKFFEVK
ncbi:hypothetical protein OA189_03210 [Prochlorococcus sp. AH-716-P20]|nr:hypothetical protein [Prochlorococcus sp. AH-716-P20]